MRIRQLTTRDVEAILRVQQEAYLPQLLEGAETFVLKMKMFPKGALGVFLNRQLAGYVFFHPWKRTAFVRLNDPSPKIPDDTDCIYIHDLAVAHAFRGMGVAKALLRSVFDVAAGLGIRTFTLVAVQESTKFWEQFGFRREETFTYTDGVRATKMVAFRPSTR